jgi:radical SAM superfamily enzyme YgiQ (UPF0313 family)
VPRPGSGAPPTVRKAAVKTTEAARPAATSIFTPDTEFGSRFLVEVVRGCANLCRFCWAGYNYLPVRAVPADRILELAARARRTPIARGSCRSRSATTPTSSASCEAARDGLRISPASLRLDDLTPTIVGCCAQSGERSITIAPETGSDRLRRVINKTVTNEEILDGAELIFASGIENLKLYYMIGLPTETDEDLVAIRDLTLQMREIMLRHARGRGRIGRIVGSVNPLMPKPGTAYQWLPMEDDGASPTARSSGCAGCWPASTTCTSTSSRSGIPTTRRCCRSAIAAWPRPSRPPSATAATGAPPWPRPASTPTSTSSATAARDACCRGTSSTAA